MTDAEINELKPGLALDLLIAEKVMALAIHPQIKEWIERGCPQGSINDNFIAGKSFSSAEPSNYSGDIAAAWAVLGRLKGQGFEITLSTETDGWHVNLGKYPDNHLDYDSVIETVAPTAPHAICIAALKAVHPSP